MKIVKKSVAKPIETRDILCYNTVRKWVSVRLQIYDSTARLLERFYPTPLFGRYHSNKR